MCKHASLAALLFVSVAAFVQAQQLPLDPATDQVAPQVAPQVQPSLDLVPDAAVVSDTAPACGCQTADSACGCAHSAAPCLTHMTWKQRCAYYQSIRNAFDRGPCCADALGGFGPLWDSYCYDKQNCCAQSACQPSCGCQAAVFPLHRRRVHCANCTQRPCDGCATAVGPPEGAVDIGLPPQPTESAEPTEVPPVPEAAPESPTDLQPEAQAARRNLLNWPWRGKW